MIWSEKCENSFIESNPTFDAVIAVQLKWFNQLRKFMGVGQTQDIWNYTALCNLDLFVRVFVECKPQIEPVFVNLAPGVCVCVFVHTPRTTHPQLSSVCSGQ